ncbi:MAG: hypothetical protein JW913_10855 [Chitinispirillaceae bacterium]|nr:hypothetical protein [Chitinispirillaceae bacterium]
MLIRDFIAAGLFSALLCSSGCGGAEFVNTADLPDNNYCRYMKEICREAREFENAYAKLTPDERKDAENILKAYRIQCNDAIDACKKSAHKK